MKWKGRPQSKNVEDRTLEDDPEIPDGTIMLGTGTVYHPDDPETKKENQQVKAQKEVGRLGKTKPIPTPTPRPNPPTPKTPKSAPTPIGNPKSRSHDNLVTPGKWTTK